MLLIRCPYCEEDRPELEFRHAGQAHIARPTNMAEISDEAFEDYFFIRENPKGIYFERWRHIHGCARFFNAARDTVSDKFVMTYRAGEKKPALGTTKPGSTKQTGAQSPAKPAAKRAPAARSSAKPRSQGAKKQ